MPEQMPYNLEDIKKKNIDEEKLLKTENEIVAEEEFSPEAIDKDAEIEKYGEMKKINIPEVGEISYCEKIIMFPKHLVEKTGGVKGYIRKIVDRHNLNNKPNNESVVNVLRKITGGNFPDKTFNHVLNGYTRIDPKLDLFKEERMILQEISSQKYFELGCPYGFFIFNLESNEQVIDFSSYGNGTVKNYYYDLSATSTENIGLLKKIRETPSLFLVASEGLSVLHGDVWDGYNEISFRSVPLFGFDHNNKVFNYYINSYKNIIHNLKFNEKTYEELAERTVKRAVGSIEYMQGIKDLPANIGHGHPIIPLIINHPDLSNLRWCHADYAAFPTKKGYNVLEMIT